MSRSKSISYKLYGIERRACLALLVALMALVSLYVYFVGKSIVNVVVREEVEVQIAEIHTRLSKLEIEYIEKKSAINMELAREQGFENITAKSFVNRGTLVGRSLTQRDEI